MGTNEEHNEESIEEIQKDHQSEYQVQPQVQPEQVRKFIPFRYAGFWMRLWAYLLDLVVIGSLNRLLIYPAFRAVGIPLMDSGFFSPINIATAICFYLYFVLMTKFFGQTLGKMVFGLKVINLKGENLSWSTVLFREWIGRFISTTIMIVYVIIAFLPKKQGLHDLFADTSVIHER